MPAFPGTRATTVRTALTGLLLASALGLTGCAGAGAAASPPESSMDAGMDHIDMSDSDMSSDDMSSDDMSSDGHMSGDGAAHEGMDHDDASSAAGTEGEPSEAAAMICSPEIRDAIASVLALAAPVEGEDSYMHGHYACNYDLEGGPLELSVHEAADPDEAQAYADSVRTEYGTAEDIEGLANLGFPAYRTAEGAVVFVKDNMALVVDARQVAVSDAGGASTRTDAAYQIATNVLACWKAHHSE